MSRSLKRPRAHSYRQATETCGEETGTASGGDTEHIWLVDPNDGTSAYLKGWRGSAVSLALVRQGVLVLGVVYHAVIVEGV
ncbi:MAG: hypothetical protein NTY19_25460 [Planctomycetota bacterium]|nr:hypothetical protein [Planctomycetota bacterium]